MMLLPPSVRVYLATRPVDMRKGHDGLTAIVRSQWQLDPYSGHLFVFLGRRLDRVKLLYFDHGGFTLLYRRLERGRFRFPKLPVGADKVEIDSTDLSLLLEGFDLSRVRKPRRWRPPAAQGDRQAI